MFKPAFFTGEAVVVLMCRSVELMKYGSPDTLAASCDEAVLQAARVAQLVAFQSPR